LKAIDTDKRYIYIKRNLFSQAHTYNMTELQGYTTARLSALLKGENRLNKVVLIYKDNRIIAILDERFHRNMSDLEQSLTDVKYLEYKRFNRLARWKAIVGLKVK
jgi:hypothetical protein